MKTHRRLPLPPLPPLGGRPGPRSPAHGRRLWAVLLLASAALLLSGVGAVASRAASGVTPDSVLIVGDSIVAQAADAARYWAPPGSSVWVYGGPGSAPCDWAAGYRDPFSGSWYRLSALVDRYHPAAVVLSFSGNPGFGGPPAGCVDNRTHYSLGALLASYQRALSQMASYATSHGARVYLEGSPPRNPATPPGPYRGPSGTLYGFNGVPQLNLMLMDLVRSPEGTAQHWLYDNSADVAVSDSSLTWHLYLPCGALDVGNCQGGQVQVRAGGSDSIHLDSRGAGATRYGMALVARPLDDESRGL